MNESACGGGEIWFDKDDSGIGVEDKPLPHKDEPYAFGLCVLGHIIESTVTIWTTEVNSAYSKAVVQKRC